MAGRERGVLLPELLVALTVLSVGLAPSAWLFARAERAVAAARARERVAGAAEGLLARLEGGLACGAVSGAEEREGVALSWSAAAGELRVVQAVVRAAGARPDTLRTLAWCP